MAIGIVKTINGVKQLVPLTTDSGQGLPLGAITAFYGTTPPNGYLICDGSEFSTTDYPALYTFLGDNHTPDLRECVLVGVGQSDNDYDAVTNPTGIQDHDVYTLGEFKDDQLQEHSHTGLSSNPRSTSSGSNTAIDYTSNPSSPVATNGSCPARKGTTTHGKQKGVNFIIKAVIGPIEDSAADQVVQNINNSRSYSTEEVNTGKTWIDGKPIYMKVFSTDSWIDGSTYDVSDLDIDEIIQLHAMWFRDTDWFEAPYAGISGFYSSLYCKLSTGKIVFDYPITHAGAKNRTVIEYTKTTDQATV